jgi:eukaryotic-like serine/threonine-protein kinase
LTPERWQQVRVLLASVVALPVAERQSFLDKSCGDDGELRQEVESLLLSHEQAAGGFLETPVIDLASASVQLNKNTRRSGGRLGAYLILEEIGRGGMGEVYRAVRADGEFTKEVAIKLVRGGFDSASIRERFRNERQILAGLDHPNVARLLDGGTTENGVPFLIMELVDGDSIDSYCDAHQLNVTARLELFRQVCMAVQYAHQHLVIHRDIKPTNILVTKAGVPKLLDFGIARIFGPSGLSQETLSMPMTPDYASPEQVRGEPITTATDVYSLGVVLYQLLTGHSPYGAESRTSHELLQVIAQTDPEPPSVAVFRAMHSSKPGDSSSYIPEQVSSAREGANAKLARRLSGDIDNIVLKALRKEPSRRYSSAEQFGDDIHRHLEGLPVAARKSTWNYRAGKFVRRNFAGVTAAAVVSITLLTGIVVTLREAHVAQAERVRAEQRFKDVRELANSDLFELHDAIDQLPGSASVNNLLIQRALKYLSKLSQEAAGDQDVMRDLAIGYERIAHLQGNFSGPGIGDSGAAVESYQNAVKIREQLVASSHRDANELKAEGTLLRAYVACLINTRRTAEAAEVAQHALSIADEILQKRPHDVDAIADDARANSSLADAIGGDGSTPSTREIPEAIRHDRKASTLLNEAMAMSPSADTQKALFLSQMRLVFHLSRDREFDEASRVLEELLPDQQPSTATKETSSSPDRRSPFFAPDPFSLYVFYDRRGIMYERQGDSQKALADYRKTLQMTRSSVKADPGSLLAQIAFVIANAKVGMQNVRLGNKAGGKDVGIAVEACERLRNANPTKSFYESLLVVGYSYQGETLSTFGDQSGARKKYSDALAMATLLRQENPQDLDALLSIAKVHDSLGVVLARGAQYDQAQDEFAAARNRSEELLRIRPQDSEALYLSGLIREHDALLESCSTRRPCDSSTKWRLPNPTN